MKEQKRTVGNRPFGGERKFPISHGLFNQLLREWAQRQGSLANEVQMAPAEIRCEMRQLWHKLELLRRERRVAKTTQTRRP